MRADQHGVRNLAGRLCPSVRSHTAMIRSVMAVSRMDYEERPLLTFEKTLLTCSAVIKTPPGRRDGVTRT
jgi:hypothetical protein